MCEDKHIRYYHVIAENVAELVISKQQSYGDSFNNSGKILEILFPDGIPKEKYSDALCVVRIIDKLFRIANKKDAFGENPYMDIIGYGLLGAEMSYRIVRSQDL